ncbi:hypothetical protein AB0K12_25555 [Nonomuraea sp. NPDC049419]|uniref:hypothetical protein n=1 Tax=Nonomuraea sp. NPDC049419 TaxID=3155772 RepID=UPI00341C3DFB
MVDARTPARLIGYWWSPDAPEWPRPHDWIDLDWNPEERDLLALYLESGQRAPYAAAGPSQCRICDKPNGNLEFTDGVFLWPQGLAHYVKEHSVRLPGEIVRRAQQWAEPMNWEVDVTWWRERKAHDEQPYGSVDQG